MVDLLKFKCYIPWECIPRKLEINHTSWDAKSAVDRLADEDEDIYNCVFETIEELTPGTASRHVIIAKNYVLIGHPDYIIADYNNIALDVDAGTCTTVSDTNIVKFDKNTGLCYGIEDSGTGIIH